LRKWRVTSCRRQQRNIATGIINTGAASNTTEVCASWVGPIDRAKENLRRHPIKKPTGVARYDQYLILSQLSNQTGMLD
jgi:hypothetical protein